MRKVAKNTRSKKNQTVAHIESNLIKERFVIDVIHLSDFVSITHRYLITMVDHFLNMIGQK